MRVFAHTKKNFFSFQRALQCMDYVCLHRVKSIDANSHGHTRRVSVRSLRRPITLTARNRRRDSTCVLPAPCRFSRCVASARVPRSARPGRASRRSSRASLGQSVADDISTGLARQATTRGDDAARAVVASICPTATCLAMRSRCCCALHRSGRLPPDPR